MGETDSNGSFAALDPFKLGDEVLLACIFGGVVMGSVGMIMKTRASSGGTDVLANIFHKWTHRPLGQMQMMVDSCYRDLRFPYVSGLEGSDVFMALFSSWKKRLI